MKVWKAFMLSLLLVLVITVVGAVLLIHSGFRATNKPSTLETAAARAVRNYSIPSAARSEKNPFDAAPQNLLGGRDSFLAKCQTCHGHDGSGQTPVGQSLYPRVPDLRALPTQNLTDGEIHYIIENGVKLTGMPAWNNPHQMQNDDSWKLVLYIRSLRPLGEQEQAQQTSTSASARYIGSRACEKCHAEIYERWQKTPMANVIRESTPMRSFLTSLRTPCTSFPKIRLLSFTGASEAAVLHETRRQLFPAARPVGNRK